MGVKRFSLHIPYTNIQNDYVPWVYIYIYMYNSTATRAKTSAFRYSTGYNILKVSDRNMIYKADNSLF